MWHGGNLLQQFHADKCVVLAKLGQLQEPLALLGRVEGWVLLCT